MRQILQNVWRLSRSVASAALIIISGGFSHAAAQDSETVSQDFTVCPLNVDGLPQKILGVSVNADGPGADGSKKIGNYLAAKGIDILGFSEDFNYNSQLLEGLGADYLTSKYRGGIGIGNMAGATKFNTDGLLYAVKNTHTLSNENIVSWSSSYGNLTSGFDENIDKGYRYALVTLSNGLQVEVYILHMDAETGDKDNAARAAQWSQLASAVISTGNSKLPKIIMGDTNSRYTRDDIKTLFYTPLQEAGYSVNDVWVDICRNGTAPTLGTDAWMVNDQTKSSDYLSGEIVDKVFYVNPANSRYNLKANSIVFDADNYLNDNGELLGDHVPVIVDFTLTKEMYKANKEAAFWEGETFNDGADNQTFYLYNVGQKVFMNTGSTATATDIASATPWQLNHSSHGTAYDGHYYCTSVYYKDSETDKEYRVQCSRSLFSGWTATVAQTSSGAASFYISQDDAVTTGAYCLKACYVGAFNTKEYRLFGVNSDGAYSAKKTFTDNTTDWIFISEKQKEAYAEYDELFTYLSDNMSKAGSLADDIDDLLDAVSTTTYSTSADAIAKMKAMKAKLDELTGIEAIAPASVATDAAATGIYSVSGEKLTSLQPGLNIVKMTDGTVKKIYVK